MAPSPTVAEPQAETAAVVEPGWLLGVAGAVALVASAARFVVQSPLWLDEALSVNIAQLPLDQIGGALRLDGHPPLYYWLLHLWMEVFGSSDGSVRALSGLFSLAALPVAARIGQRLAGRRGAVAALVLMAVTPYCVRYGTEARMYSLVMLLVLVGWLAVRSVMAHPRAANLVTLALVAGALLLTHYWALFLVPVTAAVLLWQARRHPHRRRAALKALVALGVGSLAFVPWLGVFLDQRAHTGTPWAPPARPSVVVSRSIIDLGGFSADAPIYGFLLVLLAFLAVYGRSEGATRVAVDLKRPAMSGEALVAVGTLALGAGVSFATRGAFETRYAAVVVPLLVLMAAVGITRFASRFVFWTIVALVSLLAVPGVAYNARTDRSQSAQVVRAINASARPGDLVVYCPDQLGPAASRGLRPDVRAVRYPDFGAPQRVDWRDYADRNKAADPAAFARRASAEAGSGALWMVWNASYRSLEGQCELLFNTLAALRTPQQVVQARSGVFEPSALTLFPARQP